MKEEDKKIEKLNDYYGKSWLAIEEDMFDKINELIDEVNKLKEKSGE